MTAIRFADFDALTFDCYGTLVDWERGILAGVRPVLQTHGIELNDDEVLETYARQEAELESGEYLRYREVVAGALRGICAEHGAEPTDAEAAAFGDSVGTGRRFPTPPRRSRGSRSASASALSPTATATSSRARARSWVSASTGS